MQQVMSGKLQAHVDAAQTRACQGAQLLVARRHSAHYIEPTAVRKRFYYFLSPVLVLILGLESLTLLRLVISLFQDVAVYWLMGVPLQMYRLGLFVVDSAIFHVKLVSCVERLS